VRFKSILGAFIFIIGASLIAFVIFIQTKSFGGLITRIVSDISLRQFQAEVKINNFSLSIFPPGLEMNQIEIRKEISEKESFAAELGKVGFYISLLEIEEKKLTLGEIRISDSLINYKFPKSNEEVKELPIEKINKIFDFSNDLPVGIDTLLIENSIIVANHELLEARRVKIFKKGDSFIARFHVANLKPFAEKPFKIDEAWGDAEVSRTGINVYRLKVQQDVHSLLVKGKINNYHKLKAAEFNLVGESQLYLRNISDSYELPEFITVNDGTLNFSFKTNYQNQALAGTADIVVDHIDTNLIKTEEIRSAIELKEQKLLVNSLVVKNNKESLTLTSPTEVFDLDNKSYLRNPLKAQVSNLHLNTVLRFLGPSLDVLKGELNGEVTFTYKDKNLYFKPYDGFIVKNLGLVVGGAADPFTVLMISRAKLQNSRFAVVDNNFEMSANVDLPRSNIVVDGFVTKEKVQFNARNATVNLEDFGNISNLDIKGSGLLNVNVHGPLKNTVIDIQGNTQGFEILGYKLGNTKKSISVDLGSSNVIINRVESKFGRTELIGNGVVNYADKDIAIGISSSETNSGDLAQIINPVLKDLNFLPDDLSYKAQVEVDIFGKTNLKDLKLRSRVNFTDMIAYGENFNRGAFNIYLLNQVLSFKDLEAYKGKGFIHGDSEFGLKNKSLKLKYLWENLELSSFQAVKRVGLNLDSNFSGSLNGSGTTDNFLLGLETTAFNTRSPSYNFEDSIISMKINPARVSGMMMLLGGMIESEFDLALKQGVASELYWKFTTDNIKPFLSAFLGQHLISEDFTGETDFEIRTNFKDGFSDLDLTGHLKKLTFNHPNFNVNYYAKQPQLLVKKSAIQKWDLNINEKDLLIKTSGKGVFGEKVTIIHEHDVNSKILEILLAPLLSSEGRIKNILMMEAEGTNINYKISSQTNDLDLTIDSFPFPINNVQYFMDFSQGRLSVKKFKTSLDNGSVEVLGDVYVHSDYPDVNLKFIFDNAEIPILGKSSMNVSGDGAILGNTLPYSVNADFVINRALIVNELNEFSSKSSAFSQIRFLPQNQESPLGKLFSLNVNIKIDNPVRITNSLMDVALEGEVRITGNPSRPRGEGRLTSPLNSSRIFFKNNEYMITSADINFSPKKDIGNPDFDVQALTFISNYKVYPKAYGDLESFNFDLTSDPALPRTSILSLIAFGYTDEIQSALRPEDQQSLNEVGVGSFVFDRFKISDILNKQFGLQVNLGTVIEQSGTDSLLTGRTQEGQSGQGGTIGRTRSATKIELKKRLDEALTLSVSSTMGGSIGQRQSMNLTYGLTRKIQLEGVYELRTNEEGQEDIIDNSIGGDIKFRWTFK